MKQIISFLVNVEADGRLQYHEFQLHHICDLSTLFVPQNECASLDVRPALLKMFVLKYRKTFSVGLQFVERKEEE